jgi:thymidylate synthase
MKYQIVNNSGQVENFSKFYPYLNKFLFENGDFVESRNGNTKEVLNFKTEVLNPYKRCVGNNERNINIFFLLAEAMWIWTGKKDVKFLEIFNTQMKEYSDDGKNFHAPYGFRMRHYGVSSFDNIRPTNEENNHAVSQLTTGIDQIELSLEELNKNPESRRVVISIWNAELDLCKISKDLPCNDLLMLKIRNGKLHSTISNRSNDLHWGLPTNIFQFSFVTEIMTKILGIELGTQTHNSQSLHFYLENPIADNMYSNIQIQPNFTDLYDISEPLKIDMNFFDCLTIQQKIKKVDYFMNLIINSILNDEKIETIKIGELKNFSSYLLFVYHLLWIYKDYKFSKKTDVLRAKNIQAIKEIFSNDFGGTDIYTLALNFFASKLENNNDNIIGKL